MRGLYRQGDVLIIPEGHTQFQQSKGKLTPKTSSVSGRHVLAYGEVTGHHHSLDATGSSLAVDTEGRTYLTIEELIGEVVHQEHDTVELPKGTYQVIIQQEWSDDKEPRQVRD